MRPVLDSCPWLWHDRVAYVPLRPGALTVAAGARAGSWRRISQPLSEDRVEKDVFCLWIDHGSKPEDASYAYAVLPGLPSPADAPPTWADLSTRILEQTSAVHAVHNDDTAGTGVVFWSPGATTVPGVGTVTVDQPCLVLIARPTRSVHISVANPECKPLQVSLAVNAHLRGDDAHWDAESGTTRIVYDLPDGLQAGSTVTRTFAPAQ